MQKQQPNRKVLLFLATLVVLGVILALQCVEMQQYDLFNETFGSVK